MTGQIDNLKISRVLQKVQINWENNAPMYYEKNKCSDEIKSLNLIELFSKSQHRVLVTSCRTMFKKVETNYKNV